MIAAFDHVHLFCSDVEETARFFETFLEAKTMVRGEMLGRPMIRLDLQGIMVILATATAREALAPGEGRRGLDHIGVRVRNLRKSMEEMKKKGGKFSKGYTLTGPPTWPVGTKYAFLDGPDGIRVEVVERP
jgi:catechol 2,3-dioxygenase-like lactoylglutathione lyase family enzyme